MQRAVFSVSSRRRPRYISTEEEWRTLMLPLIEKLDRPGDPVIRGRLAPYLQNYLPRQSAKQILRNDESVEKFISRQGKHFGCSLEDLVREVRSRRAE